MKVFRHPAMTQQLQDLEVKVFTSEEDMRTWLKETWNLPTLTLQGGVDIQNYGEWAFSAETRMTFEDVFMLTSPEDAKQTHRIYRSISGQYALVPWARIEEFMQCMYAAREALTDHHSER